MIMGVTHAHLGSILDVPISQTSFLVGTFFATSYSKTALNSQHLSNSNILQKGFTFHCCRMLVDDLCFSRDS